MDLNRSSQTETTLAFRLLRRMAHPVRFTYSTLFPGTTKFQGEFGHECLSVIPYAYALHQKHLLKKTISLTDTKCLYYFSQNHEELKSKRFSEKSISPFPSLRPNQSDISELEWAPPPYKEIYRGTNFGFNKPLLVISNKYNSEWGHAPINYFDLNMLENMIELLSGNYQIIYNRYTIEDDNSRVFDLGDFDFIRMRFRDVVLIQDLLPNYPNWTFNELQLRLYAECENFISVQGGCGILASYFGGKNAIYAVKGFELTSDEFTDLYPLLSKSDVLTVPYRKRDLHHSRSGKLSIPMIPFNIQRQFLTLLERKF